MPDAALIQTADELDNAANLANYLAHIAENDDARTRILADRDVLLRWAVWLKAVAENMGGA